MEQIRKQLKTIIKDLYSLDTEPDITPSPENIDADYSALIPLFLLEYYNYTADAAFLAEHLPTAEGIWAYYSGFPAGSGIWTEVSD